MDREEHRFSPVEVDFALKYLWVGPFSGSQPHVSTLARELARRQLAWSLSAQRQQ